MGFVEVGGGFVDGLLEPVAAMVIVFGIRVAVAVTVAAEGANRGEQYA